MCRYLTCVVTFPLLLSVYAQFATAVATNYTIDDTSGDERTGQMVVYRPQQLWADQNCEDCAILPDVSQMMDGTYHAATSQADGSDELRIVINFTGEMGTSLAPPH